MFLLRDGLRLIKVKTKSWKGLTWNKGNLIQYLCGIIEATENSLCIKPFSFSISLKHFSVSPFPLFWIHLICVFILVFARKTHQTQARSCIIYIENMLKTLVSLYKTITIYLWSKLQQCPGNQIPPVNIACNRSDAPLYWVHNGFKVMLNIRRGWAALSSVWLVVHLWAWLVRLDVLPDELRHCGGRGEDHSPVPSTSDTQCQWCSQLITLRTINIKVKFAKWLL